MDDTGTCINGNHCPGWNGQHAEPTDDPFCNACLERAERDVRALVYDYLDLAQLHEASMSQAVNENVSGGGHESPTLLADHVEALQAEIVHATALWEHALRAIGRLHNPRTFAPLWTNTVYDRINLTTGDSVLRKARAGALIQRAVGMIAPRIDRLAALPTVTVCPTGIEDQPTPMTGWEAVHHLQSLHSRARGTLGRTTRRMWIPGECWTCGARPVPGVDGPLSRSEPRFPEDPMEVCCARCNAVRPYADYEYYVASLLWPEDHNSDVVAC